MQPFFHGTPRDRDPGRRSDHANCRRANPDRAGYGQALGHWRGHAHPHRRCHPHVRRPGHRSININLINTSEIRISVCTDVAKGKEGLDCLREVFALNQES